MHFLHFSFGTKKNVFIFANVNKEIVFSSLYKFCEVSIRCETGAYYFFMFFISYRMCLYLGWLYGMLEDLSFYYLINSALISK